MTDDSPDPGAPEPNPADPVSPPSAIDTSVPHSARIWNYWLGGKDNHPVDREVGEKFLEVYPGIVDVARGVRYFLARAVRQLVGQAGIRQFLDIVDNDPLVLAHARALLTSRPRAAWPTWSTWSSLLPLSTSGSQRRRCPTGAR